MIGFIRNVTLYVTVKLHFRVCPEAFEIAGDLQPSIDDEIHEVYYCVAYGRYAAYIVSAENTGNSCRPRPPPFANAPDTLSFSSRALNKFPAGIL